MWYFADPMCSWCWGFSPVIDAIKSTFGEKLPIVLNLGGLRPGTTVALASETRQEILHHWHAVQQTSGQDFTFEGALPVGFIYNTEPASRAVVVLGEIDATLTLEYFKVIQKAFYLDQVDVTQIDQLSSLAQGYGVDRQQFNDLYHTDEIIQKTQAHFYRTQQFGVRGFPTLILHYNERYFPLSNGYQSFEVLEPKIRTILLSL